MKKTIVHFLVALIICLIVCAIVIAVALDHYPANALNGKGSDIGQLLGVLLGVPVAMAGSAVAIMLAAQANATASRQEYHEWSNRLELSLHEAVDLFAEINETGTKLENASDRLLMGLTRSLPQFFDLDDEKPFTIKPATDIATSAALAQAAKVFDDHYESLRESLRQLQRHPMGRQLWKEVQKRRGESFCGQARHKLLEHLGYQPPSDLAAFYPDAGHTADVMEGITTSRGEHFESSLIRAIELLPVIYCEQWSGKTTYRTAMEELLSKGNRARKLFFAALLGCHREFLKGESDRRGCHLFILQAYFHRLDLFYSMPSRNDAAEAVKGWVAIRRLAESGNIDNAELRSFSEYLVDTFFTETVPDHKMSPAWKSPEYGAFLYDPKERKLHWPAPRVIPLREEPSTASQAETV